MAISYTDPDNPSADTSVETPDTGTDWFTTNAPASDPFTPVPGMGGPVDQTGIAGTPAFTPGQVTGGGGTDLQLFSYLLSQNAGNPQAAIDQFNQLKPGSGLHPYYYPNAGKGVIGVQGQSLPYLVAPGTNGPDQTDWTFGGVPGGDSGGGPVGDYTTPTTPNYLQSPYTPTPFTEQFTAPTLSDLQATPGYQAGLNTYLQGVQRAQAARGNILSGGAVKALGRDAADYANQQYQTIYNNAFDAYKAKYGIAQDANNNNLAARQLNDNEFNQNVTNSLNQYLTRYGAYQDLIKNNLQYAGLGLAATQAGNPGGSGASVG